MKESKKNQRKVNFITREQKLKYMKESKNVCKETNICEGKSKYFQKSKFNCRKAKTLKESTDIQSKK